jgi:peroxiredoxin
MYGFDACPHCNRQKALIGQEAFQQELTGEGYYVKCRPQSEAEKEMGDRPIGRLPNYMGILFILLGNNSCVMDDRRQLAPDFTLTGTDGGEVREFTLSEFADGRPTMLVFYIYDYSPVCTAQMCEVNDMEFLTFNEDVTVLGISTDGPYSHQQYIADNDLSYPLLTDDDKVVYEEYGMIERTDDGKRQPKRGIVLIDADRAVQSRWQADDNWDTWETKPLSEANSILNGLTG